MVARSKQIEGIQQYPFRAVAQALEVIPRTLLDNCGANALRVLTELRATHVAANQAGQVCTFGIDGNKGELADMNTLKIYEPYMVKSQTIKTAIEAGCMLLRIDDIVSGMSNKGGGAAAAQPTAEEAEDTFGDQRDG